MSKEAIVERILSDAGNEADAIVKDAEEKAAAVVAAASARAEKGRRDSEAEVRAKTASISERRAAAARLDSAKILLSEKRRVIDAIYAEALGRMISLSEEECLALTDRLLKAYAEEGDEIFFAASYLYIPAAARLPVVTEKKLKISAEKAAVRGGFVLRGTASDKDLSYETLLAADRDEHQADIASEIFKTR